MSEVNLMHGDCLERMREIEPGSVDLVLTDPPYGTVADADLGKHSTDWDVVIDTAEMFERCNDVLRTNGGLVLFGAEPFTSSIIRNTHGNIPFSYRMIWLKDQPAFSMYVGCKKRPMSLYEDVCVFFKRHTKHDFEGFHPLRPYAEKVLDYIGGTIKSVNRDLGHRRAEHFFYVGTTQFSLCTEQTYNDLINVYHIDKMPGFRQYANLSEVNAEYRADLIKRMTDASPKVFNLPPNKKYKSNVLEYRKDYGGHHPTQKPVALLEDLIQTYTNEGDTVLDFTMGSGSTGVACVNTSRNFIGIELDSEYFAIAESRIQETKERQP